MGIITLVYDMQDNGTARTLPTWESWEEYVSKTVPTLLPAGGKSLAEAIEVYALIVSIMGILLSLSRLGRFWRTRHLRKVWGIRDHEGVGVVCSPSSILISRRLTKTGGKPMRNENAIGPASWEKTLAIWWAFVWRSFVLSIPFAAGLGFVGGVVAAFVAPGKGGEYGAVLGQLGMLPASILALRWVLPDR
jgi:hypothetical protein